MRSVLLIAPAFSLLAFACSAQDPDAGADSGVANAAATIRWDEWGVPHIESDTMAGAFYGFGWAQMQLHGDLILELYGRARGRAAEYWGGQHLENDRLSRTLGIPARAGRWYEAHDAESQTYLDAFAQGMNDYAAAHPEALADERERALPVEPTDPLAHMQAALHGMFVAGNALASVDGWRRGRGAARNATNGALDPIGDDQGTESRGSNAWAIAPERSASGNAMLLANPHLPWSDLFYFTEAQMTAPGFDVYGVTLIGIPMIAIGFNEHLGWTHTVNTFDGADLYELQLTAGGTYRLDGREVAPETSSQMLLVRNEQGGLEEQRLTTSESVFGPIVAMSGDRALAVRIAGLDRPLILPQYLEMSRATNREAFTAAMSRGQMPMFNTIYADADGEIAYFFNAAMPMRQSGDWRFWQGIVPGDTSEYLWTDYHAYADLPQFANPDGGFVQNANDPPWTSTFPQTLDPADYPDYFAPQGMPFRPQRSARLVLGDDSIGFDELTDYADDTTLELAVRILPQLVDRLAASDDERAQRAGEVLGAWDGSTDADSRGAVLFISWINSLRSPLFADAWDPADPLATPDTLAPADGIVASVAATVDAMEAAGVPLDAPFGDVFRLRYAGRDLPASAGPGGLGAFRVGDYRPNGDGSYSLVGGNTFVAAVEFGDRVRARGYLGYGNATQPGSEYAGNQLELFSAGEWRDIHFYAEDVAEHTRRTEQLSVE